MFFRYLMTHPQNKAVAASVVQYDISPLLLNIPALRFPLGHLGTCVLL